ncbi:MAG: sugar O-acetyltransferase [Clostridiales bacterium]|jgi:maltose O-acetyltransferase|nr:sugar O-acetyltransferase [Clostridiales bacterium]
MTEREKMLAGKIYDPFTEGMPEERTNAHRLCKLYNDTIETDAEKRNEILDELLPNRGENVYLQGPIYFDFGTNTVIGNDSYANFNFTVLDEGKVSIGNSVFIGPNVSLLTAIHPLCYQDRNSFYNAKTGNTTNIEYTAPITIGDNCWIAANVTICGGVTIGAGCVIGAGSVVTRDIPANHLAAGVPCRVIRAITEQDRLSAHPELFAE